MKNLITVTLLAVVAGLGFSVHAGQFGTQDFGCAPSSYGTGATDSGEWIYVPEDH